MTINYVGGKIGYSTITNKGETMNATKLINELKNTEKTYVEIRGDGGQKLLTLSLRKKGFRYFIGSRPGGGGRKHTPCSEGEAIRLVESALAKKGGVK